MRLNFQPGAAFVVFSPLRGSSRVGEALAGNDGKVFLTFEDDKQDAPVVPFPFTNT